MTAVSFYGSTGDAYIDGVLSGSKWAVSSLTFSFPTDPSFYGSGYASGETTTGFEAFTAAQQAGVRAVLQMYSSVINVTFTEVTETASTHGELRFAETDATNTAWAYYPSASAYGGDAWFNNSKDWFENPVKGTYAFQTMIHEIGHAMGLKHPHEVAGSFNAMPVDRDSVEYTVMSYRSDVGGGTGGYTIAGDSYPQTLMMYDIAALQRLYGANYNTNSGNSVYTWNPNTGEMSINGVGQGAPAGNKVFMTIWDGGGNDTYDLSNYSTNVTINLSPGEWTTTSSTQLANLTSSTVAVGNIANAFLYNGNVASLIENAIGGSGNDTLIGNAANNKLTGGAGNDSLDGSTGTDTAVFSGNYANYQIVYNSGNGTWTVTDLRGGAPDGVDTLTAIENVQFADGTYSLASILTPPTNPVPVIASFSNDTGTAGDNITSDNTLSFSGTAGANVTVSVYDGATLLGTATADASGQWSFLTSALGDGAHTFTATAYDGNTTTAASPVLTVTVDTVAPNTPTIGGFTPDSATLGDGITNANTLSLFGTAQANTLVHIYDGATLLGVATANASGQWTFQTFNPSGGGQMPYTCVCAACMVAATSGSGQDNAPAPGDGITGVLNDGVHTFTAVAVDAAGNTSAASTALNVTIDTAAPTAPTITSYSTDSGAVGDGITNDNTLAFTGTAQANSTVKIYDGASLLGTVTADGSGAWSLTSAALSDGAHSFTATATDTAGNVSAASSVLAVTVDTVAPAAPAISSWSADSGTVGDGVTNDNTLTFTGTAQANSTVRVYDGATLLGTATANGSGAWTYTTAALGDGAHNFTATATDTAGNTSAASTQVSVTVDTAAPSAPVISSWSTDSGTAGDGVTNDNTLSFTGTAQANSTVKVYDGATLLGTVTANGSGAWTFNTAVLSDGAHNFTVTATDAAGNTSAASAGLSVTVDTVAPAAPAIQSWSSDSGVPGDGITSDNTLLLTGSAPANSSVNVYDGATLLATVTANGSGSWTYTTAALSDGIHAFTVAVSDPAGNTATSSALSVTVDTTAPVVPTIASWSADSGVVGDGITNDNTLTFTGTAQANSTVSIYDGATLLGTATANGSGAWSFTTAALGDGAHSFTASATDPAGNTSSASSALSVTVDTTAPGAPTITSFSTDTGTVGDGITADNTLTLTGTAAANSTVSLYDGATLLGTATANGAGNWTFATVTLADGAHSFTAKATDAAGNTSGASSALAVTIDSGAPPAPVISSYSTDSGTIGDGVTNNNTLTLTGTAQANSTVQVYDGATLLGSVTANGSGAWSFTTASLVDGAHSLTASATNASGTTGAASTALNVTIDTTAPSAPAITSYSTDSGTVGDGITNDNTLALTGTAQANSTVRVYDGATLLGTVTANGSGAWTYTTSALSDGAHNLTATATDAAGNTGVASATLSVTIDTVAPSAPAITSYSTDSGTVGDGITNDNTLTLTGTAQANSTVRVLDGATLLGTATANGSGAWTFTTSALSDGAHSLTATATDVAGNTGAVSTALNVTIDTAAPSAPAITSYSTDSGTVGDGITNDNTLALTGTAQANSTVRVYDGATLLGTVTANGSGAWNYTTAALSDGAHSLTVTATDAAGNTSSASTALNVTVDTIAPSAPVIASFSDDTGVVGDHITSDSTLTFTGSAAANGAVHVYDGATLLGTVTADGSGAWTYTTGFLNNGAHNFTATVTDAAGNTGVASAVLAITIAGAAPPPPAIASFSNDTGVVGDGITSDNTLTFAGSAQASATVKIYDGGTLLGTVTADGLGAWSYTTSALSNGNHGFSATATSSGLTSANSAALNITVDTTAPTAPTIDTFSKDTGVKGDFITADNTLDFTGKAEAGSTVQVYDGTKLLGTTTANGGGKWSFSTDVLSDGAHSFKASASDVAGNMSASSAALNLKIDRSMPPAQSQSFTDPANKFAWTSYSTTMAGGQYTAITYIMDDGTKSAIVYDPFDHDDFSDYLVTYNSTWGCTRIIFNYDDGTHTVAAYDIAHEYSFSDYLATFDSNWNLVRNIFVNDDGTNSVVNYDVANEYSWAFEVFDYDANWHLIATHGVNDNGSSFGNTYVGQGQAPHAGQDQAPQSILADGHGAADELPQWIGTDDAAALQALGHPESMTLPVSGSNVADSQVQNDNGTGQGTVVLPDSTATPDRPLQNAPLPAQSGDSSGNNTPSNQAHGSGEHEPADLISWANATNDRQPAVSDNTGTTLVADSDHDVHGRPQNSVSDGTDQSGHGNSVLRPDAPDALPQWIGESDSGQPGAAGNASIAPPVGHSYDWLIS